MKLIEKKCPNCGASLEFGDTDKSCKCQYCHRSFEIERDKSLNVADIAEQFNLSELKGAAGTAAKVISGVMIGQYIISAIFGILVFVFIAFVGYNVFKHFSGNDNNIIDKAAKVLYFTDANQLNNEDFGDLDDKAYSAIGDNDEGVNSFQLSFNPKRQKVYVAYNKKKSGNIIIAVYKAKYSKAFSGESYFVYVPIKYENIKSSGSLIFELDNPSISAPEYYFDNEHTEYAYGYADMETLEKEVIEPLKKEYTVTEK